MEKERSPVVFGAGAVVLIAGIALASAVEPGGLGAAVAVVGFLAMVASVVPLLRQSARTG